MMKATAKWPIEFEAVLDSVELVLWDEYDNMVGGDSGYYQGNPLRIVHIIPQSDRVGVLLQTQRRVNNQWTIDESANVTFYLSRQQVEELRLYLQARSEAKSQRVHPVAPAASSA
jgi:hypothetical protein